MLSLVIIEKGIYGRFLLLVQSGESQQRLKQNYKAGWFFLSYLLTYLLPGETEQERKKMKENLSYIGSIYPTDSYRVYIYRF